MPLDFERRAALMCLTQDDLPLSHFEQARELCAVGARWIQVRMKKASDAERYATACAIASLCRRHGSVCIVNDSLELALAANADGVHLGKNDGCWREARYRGGATMILGGTVNNAEDAARALQAGCLDYVGVGPWRFTHNKANLPPILGTAGVAALVKRLDGVPAWAIGGILPGDLPEVRTTGAAGAAVSSALYRDGRIAENYRELDAVWSEAHVL
jgi:thiamine-phosphate pyrophosphorylase